VPRGQPGAVLTDLAEIQRRMEKFQASGRISATDGTLLVLDAQTVCVHADSPNAWLVARLLASLFRFPGESHSPGGSSPLL
jgi:5-oxoprolinase (ATP-hydrolysing) subunit A